MDFLHSFLVFLHILGAGLIVGIWVARIKNPTVMPGQFHAALLQLVTGILLVGMNEMGDGDVNHLKVGIKLAIALAIAVMAFIGQRKYKKDQPVPGALANGVGILTVVNVALATMW
ncbi:MULTISPECIES: hypothetical protein [Arthrobacter]|uniref:Uncharacterized protein n=1 Tax=Arthrobacter caoxuetaonis TaxID=2886935 RepID=A0A9X1SDW9_9MICC|nr:MULTISPECIES: hypothetical protein [Arthrobacter]MCC3283747.1 hypothetical protein [Arthrobacter caoxuetaonis]MCC3299111.1 hypothetical protein [Arthrobacter caoxuetaonis]MCC9193184.1 hypothetical protein [Arthrobacter sp. zg-Y916]USQ58556.1 hypothetical protein NF551_06985 [Arthrobacter caoxuetaonis]